MEAIIHGLVMNIITPRAWAPLYARRRRLPVHAGALLLQIYGGGNALYPGGNHLLVQNGMAELPGVRAARGRRPVARRGIPDLGGPACRRLPWLPEMALP